MAAPDRAHNPKLVPMLHLGGISNLAKAMEPFNKKYESSEDAAEDLNARAEMDEGK